MQSIQTFRNEINATFEKYKENITLEERLHNIVHNTLILAINTKNFKLLRYVIKKHNEARTKYYVEAFSTIHIEDIELSTQLFYTNSFDGFLLNKTYDIDKELAFTLLFANEYNIKNNIHEFLYLVIEENDISLLKRLLIRYKKQKDIYKFILELSLRESCKNNFKNIFHFVIDNPEIERGETSNFAIRAATKKQNIVFVKKLLEKNDVDASDFSNFCINEAWKFQNFELINILFLNEKVNNQLKEKDIELYNKITKFLSIKKNIKNF